MELATVIGSQLGVSSAAATTAGAAGALSSVLPFAPAAFASSSAILPAASAGSSWLSLSTLSTGLSLASMASSVFGGMQQGKAAATALEAQANEDLLAAKQEELKGKQQANDIMQSMLQNIAAQRLAFSGAGVDPSFGTPVSLANNTRRLAEAQVGTSRDNTMMLATTRRRSATARLQERDSARSSSLITGLSAAAGTGANLLMAREARG